MNVAVRRIAAVLLALLGGLPAARAADQPAVLADGQVLQGSFVQERQLSGFPAPLKSEGHFTLAVGQGLVWRVEQPFAVTTVISPAGLVQEAGGAETLRLPAARLPFIAALYGMLSAALSGDWHDLDQAFAVTHEGDAAAWRLRLVPRRAGDAAMPFQEIRVRGGRFAEQVEIVKAGGDRDSLTFLDQMLSAGPPAPADRQLLGSLGRR